MNWKSRDNSKRTCVLPFEILISPDLATCVPESTRACSNSMADEAEQVSGSFANYMFNLTTNEQKPTLLLKVQTALHAALFLKCFKVITGTFLTCLGPWKRLTELAELLALVFLCFN